jgi:peptide/nickel transport system permease protein
VIAAARLPRLFSLRSGQIGVALLVGLLVLVILGPVVAPHNPNIPIGVPGQSPSAAAPLGTDFVGRDVLSRILYGGSSVFWLAVAAAIATYIVGVTVGLVAGYSRSIVDPLLMRSADVLISIPALLLLLLLVTGLGPSGLVLVVGTVLVLSPGVARIVRTATLETAQRDYVKAALARGERSTAILRREILPNIAAPIMADLGTRFGGSVILIASVSYLGLGVQPPTANWAVMVSENQPVVYTNIYAVVVPCVLLGALTVAVSLIGDAYVRTSGQSSGLRA